MKSCPSHKCALTLQNFIHERVSILKVQLTPSRYLVNNWAGERPMTLQTILSTICEIFQKTPDNGSSLIAKIVVEIHFLTRNDNILVLFLIIRADILNICFQPCLGLLLLPRLSSLSERKHLYLKILSSLSFQRRQISFLVPGNNVRIMHNEI